LDRDHRLRSGSLLADGMSDGVLEREELKKTAVGGIHHRRSTPQAHPAHNKLHRRRDELPSVEGRERDNSAVGGEQSIGTGLPRPRPMRPNKERKNPFARMRTPYTRSPPTHKRPPRRSIHGYTGDIRRDRDSRSRAQNQGKSSPSRAHETRWHTVRAWIACIKRDAREVTEPKRKTIVLRCHPIPASGEAP
jgi:hypothetical protein